jgi:hypothetical protein
MAHVRKPLTSGPSVDWGPWRTARFQTEDARDGFVGLVASAQDSSWDAEIMPDDGLGAQVRWRPGHFLGLNDLAYARHGRINISVARGKGLSAPGVHVARRHGRMQQS